MLVVGWPLKTFVRPLCRSPSAVLQMSVAGAQTGWAGPSASHSSCGCQEMSPICRQYITGSNPQDEQHYVGRALQHAPCSSFSFRVLVDSMDGVCGGGGALSTACRLMSPKKAGIVFFFWVADHLTHACCFAVDHCTLRQWCCPATAALVPHRDLAQPRHTLASRLSRFLLCSPLSRSHTSGRQLPMWIIAASFLHTAR